ncbi:hypothetical protein GCM10011514_38820 [Emticicia aquatilis]|uniref:Uncharacterized protein n=1 Tax=Emticicia aquatilis TaxID=1537369 RepID=A0A916Z127_9BACT|nr:hypothetical protein [Emticicia aquatilis]GGD70982.1 hypothetical protein GCM10011514_38820 [Emticicia aquatilis]
MRTALMLVFVLLALIDLINCIIPGQEISIWFRPTQMIVLMLWVNQLKLNQKRSTLISIPLVMAAIMDYIFFKFGAKVESVMILLIFIKYGFFLYLLYIDIGKLRYTKKLLRWAINYIIIFTIIAALVGGKSNILAYMLGIQVAIVFLFISLKKSDSEIFRQKYLGYCLMIFSLIFGKILLADSRWFVELISRFSFVVGHLLFISGLANVKLFSTKSNTLDYQAVK